MPSPYWNEACRTHIITPDNLSAFVKSLKQKGKKIVTLNGSFDLLHAGHLHIIYEAKKQGDILFVLLNSDSSIAKYKGKDRPIISLPYRMELLAALRFVDYISWFDEVDPRNILKKIQPDIHVNGSEYAPRCLEADVVEECGGTVYYVDRIPGLATSDILKKIHSQKNCALS